MKKSAINFQSVLKPLKNWPHFLYFWCFFCRNIALSWQSRLQHHSYVHLFCWANWIVQLACSIDLRISMFMIFLIQNYQI